MGKGDHKSAAQRRKSNRSKMASVRRAVGNQRVRSSVTLHPFGAIPGERMTDGSQWDHGTGTPTAMRGTVLEPVQHLDEQTGNMVNPNNVTRRKRLHEIDRLARPRGKSGKVRLSPLAYRAATALLNAYEATQKTAPAIKQVQVDSSAKPDSNVAIMIDRTSALVSITKRIDARARYLIDWVVLENRRAGDHPKCGSRQAKRDSLWAKWNAKASVEPDPVKRRAGQEAVLREIKTVADDRVKAAKCLGILNEALEGLGRRLGL